MPDPDISIDGTNRRRVFKVQDLFDFYYEKVKPLYSAVQATNVLPMETLFEINAAFDHLSRHWTKDAESEDSAVRKSLGHLKRGCLDIFKIVTRDTLERYKELMKVDISIVDNGRFEPACRTLIAKIRKGATEARQLEGTGSEEDFPEVKAFDKWCDVFADCVTFEKDFYLSPNVPWAKRRDRWMRARSFAFGVATSIAATLLVRAFDLWPYISRLCSKASAFLKALF